MVSIGGNKSKSSNQSATFVDPQQQQYLGILQNAATNGLLGNFGSMMNQGMDMAADLTGSMRDLIGGATGLDTLEANIGSLEQRLNENLMENILPGIKSQYGVAGTRGSREGIDVSNAIGENQEAFATGISQLMDRQQGRDLMGASMLPDVFNLGISGFQGGAAPLLALAQILGDPTVLAQSSGTGKSGGFGISVGT